MTKFRFNSLQVFTFSISLFLTIYILYRTQINNGFLFLLGDNTYDNTIHTAILEHWFNVAKGINTWSEVNYFYPYTKTIAQTDAYFLVSFFYIPFRVFGYDPYLATEFAGIGLKIFGFIFAYLFSKIVVNFQHRYALLVAILFSLNNAMSIHGYRIQLATVAFVPALGLLFYLTIKYLKLGNRFFFTTYGTISGVFFGLWCFTCFYASYFFFLQLFIFSAIFVALNFKAFRIYLSQILQLRRQVFAVAFFSALSLMPFIFTFYPKSKESNQRSFEAILSSTVPLEEILEVGSNNIFNYPIYQQVAAFISPNYIPRSNWEYYNNGFAILIFLIFTLSVIYLLINVKKYRSNSIFLMGLSSIILILLIVNFKGFSLWKYVYEFFPAGKALGVISTGLIFVSFPVYVTAIYFLTRLRKNLPIFIFISVLLILSEVNSPALKLDRKTEVNKNFTISNPALLCDSFYVSGWINQETTPGYWEWFNNQYAHNVSAMLLSQKLNIPTINGMASFIPKNYDLVGPNGTAFSPNSQEYQNRVNNYILKFKLENVCRIDLNTKEWVTHQNFAL